MQKTTRAKKVAKKVIAQPLVEQEVVIVSEKPSFKYLVDAFFNDEHHIACGDDIEQVLMSIKPTVLKTRIKFYIENDGKVCEKIYPAYLGRSIFRNKLAMKVFTNRLIFK